MIHVTPPETGAISMLVIRLMKMYSGNKKDFTKFNEIFGFYGRYTTTTAVFGAQRFVPFLYSLVKRM